MASCARIRPFVALALCAAMALPAPAAANVELKQPTRDAFQRYVRMREATIEQELKRETPFLWVDTQPEAKRREAYATMKRGEVSIERLKILENGKEVECPDGIIHHWMGTVFIPGAKLEKVIALVQQYDRHHINYTPEVTASRTVERNGNDFKIFMRFKKKKAVITAILNTNQDVRYTQLGPTRWRSVAKTTRVAQVDDPDQPDGAEKPVGKDDGFMWQLYTYWLFEERDGGVYIQCEAISLSRDVPFLLKWLRGYITSVPKESLMFTLGTTRTLLTRPAGNADAR